MCEGFPIFPVSHLWAHWTMRGEPPRKASLRSSQTARANPEKDQTWHSQADTHLEKQSGNSFQRFLLSPGHAKWILF